MRFTLIYRDVGSERTQEENYEKDHVNTDDEALETARGFIDYFNSTLRPGESQRELVEVKIDPVSSIKDRDWEKTNLVTIIPPRGHAHDTCKCRRCGVTGKRFGLSGTVAHDHKFKAKCYVRCDTALAHLEKKRKTQHRIHSKS